MAVIWTMDWVGGEQEQKRTDDFGGWEDAGGLDHCGFCDDRVKWRYRRYPLVLELTGCGGDWMEGFEQVGGWSHSFIAQRQEKSRLQGLAGAGQWRVKCSGCCFSF